MAIRHWSDEIIVVDLPEEPEIDGELSAVTEYVAERDNHDVVVDFSSVGAVTSSNLSKLLRLRQVTTQAGGRLVLCCIAPATEAVFVITGLCDIFELTCDKFAALATLEMIG